MAGRRHVAATPAARLIFVRRVASKPVRRDFLLCPFMGGNQMSDTEALLEVFEKREQRRLDRRRLFRVGGGFAVGAAAGAVLGACSSSAGDAIAQAPPVCPVTPANIDNDILNFALQLEYLEAQFYSFAAFGVGLPNASLTGTGTQGAVIGGRQVAFSDPLVRRYANEIAQDEMRT